MAAAIVEYVQTEVKNVSVSASDEHHMVVGCFCDFADQFQKYANPVILIHRPLNEIKQVLPKVIWEERIATPTSENALTHCVCYL